MARVISPLFILNEPFPLGSGSLYNMLKVQKYLKNHSLDDLYKEYKIEYSKKNGKVSLHYNIYNSPKGEDICNECCGLILRDFSWDVVSYPFNRIYDYESKYNSKINISRSNFVETMGGALVQVYYDNIMDEWCISSERTSEGDELCKKILANYKMLTLMAFDRIGKPFKKIQKKMDADIVYIFELITPYSKPYNRKYNRNDIKLILVGIRDLITLKELHPTFGNVYLNFPLPMEYKFCSIEQALEFVSKKSDENYGLFFKMVDLYDISFDRFIIKSTFNKKKT